MRVRREQGQATPEYVAIVLVVAVVLGSAAAITSGGLGDAALNGMRRGLCALTGRACAPLPVRADLPPCMLRSREEENTTQVGAIVVGWARDRHLRVERFSDGHVEVTFADGRSVGLSAQAGGVAQLGPLQGTLQAGLGVHFSIGGGSTWRFRDARTARTFVRRWRHRQGALGGLLHDLHETCLLCRLVGRGPARMPTPDVTWTDRGDALDASAGARLHFGADVAATMQRQTIGVRVERGGGRTRYLSLSTELAAAVLHERRHGAALLVALHEDARGRPDRVELRGIRRAGRDTREVIVETSWNLPVRTSDDLGAVRSLVGSMLPRSTYGTALSVVPFLRRARTDGTVTVRRLIVRRDGGDESGLATPNAGAGVESGREIDRLVAEDTRLPGQRALPRDDCLDG